MRFHNRNFTSAVQFVSSFLELSLFSGLLSGGKQFTEKLQIHHENKKQREFLSDQQPENQNQNQKQDIILELSTYIYNQGKNLI